MMTARCEVIFWIAIVFVFVSPTDSIRRNHVCSKTYSTAKWARVSFTETYRASTKSWCWLNCWETRTRMVDKPQMIQQWWQKGYCCEGYEEQNGICKAECPQSCTYMNGYCEEPNVCQCNYGWNGKFCNESLVCSVRMNSTETISDSDLLKNVPIVSASADSDKILPTCRSECRSQISSTTVNIARSADGLIYYIPSYMPCNRNFVAELVSWKKYSIWIGAVMGITVLGVLACAVYVLTQKREIAKKRTNEPPQSALSNYVEENEINLRYEELIRDNNFDKSQV